MTNSRGNTAITKQDIPYVVGAKRKCIPFIKIFELRDLKEVDK